MALKPYHNFFDQICRRNQWILGEDKGEMVIGVATGDGGQRSVVVNDFQDTSGQLALRMWSPIVQVGRVPADQALKINMQLPHGALAEHQGQVVLVSTRVFKGANPSEVSDLVAALATFAAFYAKHYGGR